MNLFDLVIVQPIFNLLLGLYALVSDFGVAIILLSILVRFALWPLLKRQLNQTKLMRAIQPEIKKIKVKAKGNKQLETQLMMELYRERGIKLSSSFVIILIQLPILIALFTVIKTITVDRSHISQFTYSFLHGIGPVKDILSNTAHFHEKLFGIVDLTQTAVHSWPILVLALLTALFQYIQSRQILPNVDSKKRLRDVLKESAAGKETDQSEISAIMSRRLVTIMPILTLFVMINLPGALVLYYATQSFVAILQQRYFLNKDEHEMEQLADQSDKKPGKKATLKARAREAREAEIVDKGEK